MVYFPFCVDYLRTNWEEEGGGEVIDIHVLFDTLEPASWRVKNLKINTEDESLIKHVIECGLLTVDIIQLFHCFTKFRFLMFLRRFIFIVKACMIHGLGFSSN